MEEEVTSYGPEEITTVEASQSENNQILDQLFGVEGTQPDSLMPELTVGPFPDAVSTEDIRNNLINALRSHVELCDTRAYIRDGEGHVILRDLLMAG